jgi:hypothetical protein
VTGLWSVASLAPGESASIRFEIDDTRAAPYQKIVVKASTTFSLPAIEAHAYVQTE